MKQFVLYIILVELLKKNILVEKSYIIEFTTNILNTFM